MTLWHAVSLTPLARLRLLTPPPLSIKDWSLHVLGAVLFPSKSNRTFVQSRYDALVVASFPPFSIRLRVFPWLPRAGQLHSFITHFPALKRFRRGPEFLSEVPFPELPSSRNRRRYVPTTYGPSRQLEPVSRLPAFFPKPIPQFPRAGIFLFREWDGSLLPPPPLEVLAIRLFFSNFLHPIFHCLSLHSGRDR